MLDKDILKLGLYLAPEFNVLSGYRLNASETEIISFGISESAVTIEDVDSQWDIVTARYKPVERESLEPKDDPLFLPAIDPIAFTHVSEPDWSLIHPEIVNVSAKRFASGHFADSVEAAFKAVNERVRKMVSRRPEKNMTAPI